MDSKNMLFVVSRRRFCGTLLACTGGMVAGSLGPVRAQMPEPGQRPVRDGSLRVLNPRDRVPVGIIIDDSTCLVNLNRFAMPQFDAAWGGRNPAYHKPWREWPAEIPDAFVRRFAEWSAARGVRGKYSVVPFPACVGRLDRGLPGWSRGELEASLRLVREELAPRWDIHPEMVTHTRVIDLRTGHPHPEWSLRWMENWDWTTGRSAAEIAEYMAYALRILRNVELPCEGITTPGGFGSRARPQLARATLDAVRAVFGAEIPHYFRDVYESGAESVAPRVELASGLDGHDPRCVVSVVGCTGDWTGGWDCSEPAGADRFITEDGQGGRLPEVIRRGEPALLLAHWTGVYWNGRELGFRIFQEVERRLREHWGGRIRWMKLSEVARYWAARELTGWRRKGREIVLRAPFACPDFTVEVAAPPESPEPPAFRPAGAEGAASPLQPVGDGRWLEPGRCRRTDRGWVVCVDLPRGESRLRV